LATKIPTELSIPHLVIDSFKNLAAIGLNINYQFAQLKGAQQGGPAKEAPKEKEAPKKEEKKPVKDEKVEEPEEEVALGDMFGD